jgi:hypothetical protein
VGGGALSFRDGSAHWAADNGLILTSLT